MVIRKQLLKLKIPQKRVNKLIEQKLCLTDEQTNLALKHPDGRIIRISSEYFNALLSDIENYIDYKMHMEYEDIRNYMLKSGRTEKLEVIAPNIGSIDTL